MRQSTGASKIRSEKIVLIGEASTGKTSLVNRFIHDKFSSNSEATIGAIFINKTITVDDQEIRLEIWDTGGSEKYRSLAPMYFRDARAAIIVFDITNKNSFTSSIDWIEEFREKSQPSSIIVAAANKMDLEEKRQVSKEEATDFSFQNGLEFIKDTSALTGQGVRELFEDLARQLLLLEPQSTPDDMDMVADIAVPPPPPQEKQSCNC